MKDWKDNVSFTLVEPSEWGNIGAAARVIKNMGFKRLSLVNPPHSGKEAACPFAKNALDVLESAAFHETLKDAVKDKSLVVGTTRRTGRRRGIFMGPESALRRIPPIARKNKVAILFGREQQGLTNDEIEECGFLITIPASGKHPSLNLSHAVAIIAYELSKFTEAEPAGGAELISREELAGLYRRLSHSLMLLEYIPQGSRDLQRKMMSNIKHLFGRTGLTRWEAQMLHGICTRIEKKLKP